MHYSKYSLELYKGDYIEDDDESVLHNVPHCSTSIDKLDFPAWNNRQYDFADPKYSFIYENCVERK